MTKILKSKKILFFAICLFSVFQFSYAQRGKKKANIDTNEWRYEVEAVGTGTTGTYQIKVWSYSKYPETAIEQAKKNAVHAVIFKGFPNKGRIQGQKPLAKNPNLKDEKQDFFNNFFKEGGDFQKYVLLADDGAIGPGDRIKISKKEYKIGVVVSVKVADLRKDLEKQGIIKGLSSGF